MQTVGPTSECLEVNFVDASTTKCDEELLKGTSILWSIIHQL